MEKLSEKLEQAGIAKEAFPSYHKSENKVFEVTKKDDEIQVFVIDTSTDIPQLKKSKISDAVDGTMLTTVGDWQLGLMKVRRYCHQQLMK